MFWSHLGSTTAINIPKLLQLLLLMLLNWGIDWDLWMTGDDGQVSDVVIVMVVVSSLLITGAEVTDSAWRILASQELVVIIRIPRKTKAWATRWKVQA